MDKKKLDDLTSIISNSGDVEAVKASLESIKIALNASAYDYAKGALKAANEALEAALIESPCSVVFARIQEYQELALKAEFSVKSCSAAIDMLSQAEETGDESIDKLVNKVHRDSVDTYVVYSMLEGAATRAQLSLNTMPDNPVCGARCVPSKLDIFDGSKDPK